RLRPSRRGRRKPRLCYDVPLERDALKRRAALFSGPAVLLLPAVLRAQAATGSLDLDVHRADGGPIAGAEARLEAGRLDRAGETGPGASWTLDGVDVTDPAAIGSTLLFPDVDAMSEVVVRTSAVDVRVRTPGVQMGLFLRAPDDRWHGRAHLRDAPAALQSDNLPAALAGRPFLRNRTRHVREAGAEAGGPMGAGSWLWG